MASERNGHTHWFASSCAALVLGVVLSSCGGDAGSAVKGGAPGPSSNTATSARPPKLVARLLPQRLPAALSGEAAVAEPQGIVLAGGLDSSLVSTSAVLELHPGGAVTPAGQLAEPLHDAAAAIVGGGTLVLGGGSATSIDGVERLVPGGTARVVGRLPAPASDVAALTVGGRAYVIGGYDGTRPLRSVLETADGAQVTRIAELPSPARYAAVAALGSTIYVFGGELADGSDSSAIQAIDLRTRRTRLVGRLPQPLSHASAIELAGTIYVLGGSTAGAATDRILSFRAGERAPVLAGHLPTPVTNAAAAVLRGQGYLIGGLGADGTAVRSLIRIGLSFRP